MQLPRTARHMLQCLLVLVPLTLVAVPAMAVKPAAANAAAAADRALAAGEFGKAIDLYQDAWRLDPHPEFLLLLARAEHQAGQLDRALEHYNAYLAAPSAAADRIAQARGFARDIERMRLEARVHEAYVDAYELGRVEEAKMHAAAGAREMSLQQQAEAAARAGDEKAAARFYLTAHRAVRDRDDVLLFKAAAAEQYAQQWREAAAHYEEYLRRAPATAPNYTEAVTRLEAVRRRLGVTPSAMAKVAKPEAKPVVIADVPRDNDPATIGWTLVKIGGALALVGAGSYIWTYNEQAEVDALLRPDASGKIRDLSREEAAQRVESLNNHVLTAAILGGVGVAAAGVGTYLILRSPSRVSVVPAAVPAGVAVAWRF